MTDQKFRERLQHFEADPPDQVWHEIASALQSDKRKKRVLWIGRMAASVALLLAIGGAWLWLGRAPETQMAEKDTREQTIPEEMAREEAEIPETRTPLTDSGADLPVAMAEQQETSGEITQSAGRTREFASGHSVHGPETSLADANIPGGSGERITGDAPYEEDLETVPSMPATQFLTDLQDPVVTPAIRPYSPPLPDEGEGIDVFDQLGEETKLRQDKWGVGTQVSPIYSYRNLEVAGASAASASYYNDVEEGIVSYAGGLSVHYAPLKRLSVQSGLYYSSMGMKVGNAYYASMDSKESFLDQTSTIQASINNSTGIIETQQGLDYAYAANPVPQGGMDLSSQSLRANTSVVPTGEILQQFEYLELPLILRYRVVDRKLGFHLLGGLSSNFLVGNSAYYREDGNKEPIGTTGNLRPVNYSSVVGLGVDYSITRRFHINLEPTFRYYLNSINTGSLIKSHPYTIGFFTGLLYTF